MPSALSSSSEPVGITGTTSATRSPMRMTEPLPYCFSIWVRAAESARFLFSSIVVVLVMVCMGRWGQSDRPGSQGLRSPRRETGWLRTTGRRNRRTSRAYVGKRCRTWSGNPHSPVRPPQAAVQALDGGVLFGHQVDRPVFGFVRPQANGGLADLPQLDRAAKNA